MELEPKKVQWVRIFSEILLQVVLKSPKKVLKSNKSAYKIGILTHTPKATVQNRQKKCLSKFNLTQIKALFLR